MTSRQRTMLAIVGVALLAVIAWWARPGERAPRGRIEVAGNVRAEARTIAAPAITYPTIDVAAGLPKPQGAAQGAAARSAAGAPSLAAKTSLARAGIPVVAGMLTSVTVMQGDRVEAGQVVARLDTRLLTLGVEQAQAAATQADTDVSLLTDNLRTIAENEAELADARGRLVSGRSQLRRTGAQLTKARTELIAARKKAVAGRDSLESQLGRLGSAPGTPTAQQLKLISAMRAKLAQIKTGIRTMDAGIAKVDAGLAKVASALAKLPAASARLSDARSALTDARQRVEGARDTLEVVADGRELAVELARTRLADATVVAPEPGRVLYARRAGTVAMVGAPLVRIRPDGPQLVDTYLTAEQLRHVEPGSIVEVRCDSLPGTFPAHIARIGSFSEFPSTSFPTEIVHMTRAIRVTASLDASTALPAGTPVDLTIHTR